MQAGEVPESSIVLRPFYWSDLEEYTSLVNEVQGLVEQPRAFSASYMAERLAQPGRQPEDNCFLEEGDESLTGYALVLPELVIGRVVVEGGVLPSHRRQGVGSRLLEAALKRAQALEAGVVHIAAPGDNPKSHRFLEHRGFSLVRRYWGMLWQNGEVPELETPPGFSLRSFASGDEGLLTRVQNSAFGDSWGFCPNTVEEISYRVRMSRCNPEGILFLIRDGGVAAYCWTLIEGDGEHRAGVVGMAGVSPPYRGLGLSRVALLAGMRYLRSQGVEAIDLTVDSENLLATRTYLALGFRRVSETLWYEGRLGSAR